MKNNDYDFRSAQLRLASRHTQNQSNRVPTRNIRMTGMKVNNVTQNGFNKNSERLKKAENRLKNKQKPQINDPEKKMANLEREIHDLMHSCALEEVTLFM
jgi:hypothetical protein